MSLFFDYKFDNLKRICLRMSSRSNSVKAVKKSPHTSLFLVEFAAHSMNVEITPIKRQYTNSFVNLLSSLSIGLMVKPIDILKVSDSLKITKYPWYTKLT
jgi:hypothetical protein